MTTRQERIRARLEATLQITELLFIENESSRHSVPQGSETHFKLTIVSPMFQGSSRVQRHRLINNTLADELAHGLHALSLHLYAPDEWQQQGAKTPASPPCQHAVKS